MTASGALDGCLFHGEGTFRWPDGQTYVGTYNNGATVRGKLTYPNTMSYEGEFDGGYTFHGQGEFNWTTYNADGSVAVWSNRYVGEFQKGGATGLTGTMYYVVALDGSNGAGLHYFTGVMAQLGLAQVDQTGTGKIVFEDGTYYIGQVYLDVNHVGTPVGEGTYYNADGTTFVPHVHSFSAYVSDNNATCTEDGTETAKCDGCEVTDTRVVVDSKLGHSFTNYVSNNDATLEADGTETAKCDRCDVTDTRADEDSNQVVTDYMLDDDRKYTGLLVNGTPEGEGTLIFVNSNCKYTGAFVNGLYHGNGTFDWSLDGSGWKFVGTFAEGKATYGKTTTTKTEGLIWYEGAMNDLNNIKSDELGTGYFDYANGCNYTGQMTASGALEGCLFHGEGTFKWSYDESGWKFVGTFENSVATYGKTTTNKTSGLIWYEGAMNGLNNIKSDELGTGYYDYGNGCNYTGQMTASGALDGCLFHGEGTFKWSYDESGWKFEGTFVNGTATYGKKTTNRTSGLIWYEGAVLNLDTIDSSQLGYGYYDYGNGCSYTGQMKASADMNGCTFEGEGTFRWPSGDTFVGTYAGSAPISGKYTYSNTMAYQGEISSNYVFHGQGEFNWTTYNADGSVAAWGNRYVGEFQNGGATGLTGTMYYAVALDGSNGAGLHYFTGVMAQLGLAQVDQIGEGKIVFEDGSYYIGQVYLDANHVASVTGTGTYYNADGSVKA